MPSVNKILSVNQPSSNTKFTRFNSNVNKKNIRSLSEKPIQTQSKPSSSTILQTYITNPTETAPNMQHCIPPSECPSELLMYYRRKVESLTNDHETMQRRLDKIADVLTVQKDISLELRQRETEIAELQRALSDMQVYLFQEREHVLRLYAENDRLKIRELDDRRKIQLLLQMTDLGPAEMTYFFTDSNVKNGNGENREHTDLDENLREGDNEHKDEYISGLVIKPVIPTAPVDGIMEYTASGKTIHRPATSTISQTNSGNMNETNNRVGKNHTVSRSEHEAALREIEMAKATIKSLRTQLEEQTRIAREQIDSLMEDRKAIRDETDALCKRHEEKARSAAEQLKRCQDLLYDSTKEFLAQRNQFRQAEKVWITEKAKLLGQLETKKLTTTALASKVVTRRKADSSTNACNIGLGPSEHIEPDHNLSNMGLQSKAWAEVAEQKQERLMKTIENLEYQLEQQQKLADMYREQVIELEEELVRNREEGVMSKDIFKDQAQKLHERLEIMSQRYQNLERRRQLEMEGYRTDIGLLRKKLREVEKQLLKLTLGLTDDLDLPNQSKDVDIAILKQVKASTVRTSQLMNELKNLKLKMYNLEDELRKI